MKIVLVRHPRVLLVAILVGVALLAGIALAEPLPWSKMGAAYRSLGADGAVVAKVNGRPVSEGELRIGIAAAGLNNALSPVKVPADRRNALQRLLQTRALSTEAARRGIDLSELEINAYIANVRQGFTSGSVARMHLDEFLAGSGMTIDQFFADPFVRSRYAEDASIGRLRVRIIANVPPDAANSTWDAFVRGIQQTAAIEILDPALR